MEILQEDLPFGSPFFSMTSVFSHPDVRSVQFLKWPVPHFLIVGTVDGVQSAMRRRYAFFIQHHAVALFKQESADSLISRAPRHLPDLQHTSSLCDVPELEPIPSSTNTSIYSTSFPSSYYTITGTDSMAIYSSTNCY
jgi:hypothetical protein